MAVFVNACIVDICDVYQKVQQGYIDKTHLDMRMHMLKLGTMKAPVAKMIWLHWQKIFMPDFVAWFEAEMYGDKLPDDQAGEYSKFSMSNLKRD